MTNQQATRRYYTVLIPGMIAFLGASFGLKAAESSGQFPEAALYAGALLPIVLMLGMFWAHWRYMNEIDEFLRSIHVKATFVAIAAVMTVATGWGFLELFAEVPALPVYYLNPLFWVAFALAEVALSAREARA